MSSTIFLEGRVLTLESGLYRIWRMDRRKISRLVGQAGNFEMALDLFESLVEPGSYLYMTRTAESRTKFVLNAVGTRRSNVSFKQSILRLLTKE